MSTVTPMPRTRATPASVAALLETDVSADYLTEQAKRYAQQKTVHRRGANSVVLFRLDTEWFALPTAVFTEITVRRPVHTLPHRGPVVVGVTNIRGELLVCISLAHALGITEAGRRPESRLAVIGREGDRFVFAADEIAGLHHYDEGELSPVPATLAHTRTVYTRGMLAWRDRAVGVLDADALFRALNRSLA